MDTEKLDINIFSQTAETSAFPLPNKKGRPLFRVRRAPQLFMNVKLIFNDNEKLERISSIMNKVIHDVTEFRIRSSSIKYVGWSGTVGEEYFSIVFTAGVITVSISERSMLVGQEYVTPLISKKLLSAQSTKNPTKKIELFSLYLGKHHHEELEAINFNEIMEKLKWTFLSEKVKVQYNLVDSSFYNCSNSTIKSNKNTIKVIIN